MYQSSWVALAVKNVSRETMDLGGYVVDFGFMDDDEGDEQKGTIAQGTTVDADSTLKIVADAGKREAGVGVSRDHVMPSNEEEVYAIASPEGTVVARSDKDKYMGKPETTTTTTTTEAETTTTTETEETTTEETTTTEEETTTEETTTTAEETSTTTTTKNLVVDRTRKLPRRAARTQLRPLRKVAPRMTTVKTSIFFTID